MIRSKGAVVLAIILAFVMPSVAVANGGALNTFSPYSIYGLGELHTQGTLQTRSMGGAGIAVRNRSTVNLLNPAAYSTQLRKSVLFDFGLEGGTYMLSQNGASGRTQTSYTTFNFKEIAFQMPISKGVGFALSVTPYSSVGYDNVDEYVMSDYYVEFMSKGYGDIAEAKIGFGWEVLPNLSVGVAGQYYWGTVNKEFYASFVPVVAGGSVNSMAGLDNTAVSSLKGQVGLQWDMFKSRDRLFTLGATYDIGGDLSPTNIRQLDDENKTDGVFAQSDTTTMRLMLPSQLGVGLCYASDRFAVAVDYSLQNWSRGNSGAISDTQDGLPVTYGNVGELRVGAEYTPRYSDVRNYFNRINYRAGLRLGSSQYRFGGKSLADYAITAGMGFPINMMAVSKINLGLEWGSVGATHGVSVKGSDVGLVRQNQFKFALSFTLFGDDYWFQRMRIE